MDIGAMNNRGAAFLGNLQENTRPPSVHNGPSQAAGRPTYAFGMQAWKRPIMARYFKDRDFTFIPLHLSERQLTEQWLSKIDLANLPDFFLWGLNVPDALSSFIRQHQVKTFIVEDGFLRSSRAHASRTPPLSLTVDTRTAYFDSRTPSDLEHLLNTYDFQADEALLDRAKAGMSALLETGISKYNGSRLPRHQEFYGPKDRKRVLVIGQVEGDASIRYGCSTVVTDDDLIRLATSENPDAEIIYKPHPDVLNKVRTSRSNPAKFAASCHVLTHNVPIAQALETIDQVYTITSLAGFEALMRGVPVTVLGLPFYAGWGLTDDRQQSDRRRRILTITELFAATYFFYPLYFEPETGAQINFEDVVELLQSGYEASFRFDRPASMAWEPWGPFGLLGWRHLLTGIVATIVSLLGTKEDAEYYRAYPIDFFRERPSEHYRMLGRLLYPF